LATDVRRLFHNAEDFRLAFEKLDWCIHEQNRFVMPTHTLSALANELFLKCLLVVENPSRDPPRTHDLAVLFKKLTLESKEVLREEFGSDFSRRSLDEAIEAGKETFVTYRYSNNERKVRRATDQG
jgi:hypothetical protein